MSTLVKAILFSLWLPILVLAVSVARWRSVAAATGVSTRQADRLASAFEHEDLRQALAL